VSKESEKEDLVIRYFFGELDEDEEDRIEQAFLTDDQFFEQMLSIEHALIDDYVRGLLSEPEGKKVEAFLRSSRRKQREADSVNSFVNDLSKTRTINPNETSTVSTERSSLWKSFLALLGLRDSDKRFSFVLPLLVFAFGIGLISWNIILNKNLAQIESMQHKLEKQNRDLQQELDSQNDSSKNLSQQIEEVNRRSDQIEQEFAAMRESGADTTPRNIVTLALTLQAFNRSTGQLKVVRIDSNTKWLQIIIDTGGDDYRAYSAVIKSFEDRVVWSKDVLRPAPHNPSRLMLMITARSFANGDYALTLRGQRDNNRLVLGDYYFRVKMRL
jgi:hypothetical protein